MRVSRLFLAAACAALSLVHGPASADAFSEGKALGTSQVDAVFNKAKTGEGSEAIHSYGTQAPEQGYFLGGKGYTASYGAAKISSCAGAESGDGKMEGQECAAVNFLAKNPQIRKQVHLPPNDSLFHLHDQVSKDPCAILGPGYCDEEETQCVEVSETIPAQYTLETCSTTPAAKLNNCTSQKEYITSCVGVITKDPEITIANSNYPATKSGTSLSTPANTTQIPSSYPATSNTNHYPCSSTVTAGLICENSAISARANQIVGIYKSIYNRCGDPTGLVFWEASSYSISQIEEEMRKIKSDAGLNTPAQLQQFNTDNFCGGKTFIAYNSCQTTSTCSNTTYSCPYGGTLSGTTCNTTTTSYSCDSSAASFVAAPNSVCSSSTPRRNTIIGLYQKWFRRCADNAGLDFWDSKAKNANGSIFSTEEIDNIFSTWPGHVELNAGNPNTMPEFCGDKEFKSPNLCKVQGGALSGQSCITPIETYSCPDGGMLVGTTCYKQEYNMKCPADAPNLSGGGTSKGTTESTYYQTLQPLTCASTDPEEASIIQYYENYFGRCPDAPGLTWWSSKVKLKEMTLEEVRSTLENWPDSKFWVSIGKPTIRFDPYLCPPDRLFVSPDKCMERDSLYTSQTPPTGAKCSSEVNYADVEGHGCMQGTTANSAIGYTVKTTCEANMQPCWDDGEPVCTKETKVVNGVTITDDCMTSTHTKVCLTGGVDASDCDEYSNNNKCNLQSSACTEQSEIGTCLITENKYRCETKPATTHNVLDCSKTAFCPGGNCFDTGYEPDKDFGPAMALLEAAREIGVYGNEASIFGGFAESCRIRLFGLGNCCNKSSKGGTKNNNLAFKLAAEVGSTTLEFGSRYMYDALFTRQTNILVDSGMGAMLGGVAPDSMLASFTPSIGLYGFSVSIGAPTAGFVTQALGGSVYTLGSIPGTNMVFGFDPYTFVIAIVIQVIMEMTSCDEDEIILAMKKGQNLCVSFGKYCSKKRLGACMERKESSCCFNSRLARIINEQGRAQLGKGWGSQKHPDCSGFTAAELEKLDFSKIDLSEFIAEIMGSIKLPNLDGISQNIQGVVQDKMQNYYERGNQMPASQQP